MSQVKGERETSREVLPCGCVTVNLEAGPEDRCDFWQRHDRCERHESEMRRRVSEMRDRIIRGR